MEWIKTEIRKPEILKCVIFKTNKPIHTPLGMCNRQIFWGYWNGYAWSDENQTLYTHIENVTEWLNESCCLETDEKIEEEVKEIENKQETLEEAAKKIFSDFGDITRPSAIKRALKLVKWQQEQNKNLYSEEEVYQILSKFRELRLIDFQEWFEQFKKQ